MTATDTSELAKKKPEKRLTHGKRSKGGRNQSGRTTVRFRGGGVRKKLREVEFGQRKKGIPGTVEALEYDPNRTAFLALVKYQDGDRRYILAAQEMKVGQEVLVDEQTPLQAGNRMQLKHIPVGVDIYNIELTPGKGGQMVRSAGSSARILSHEGGYAQVLFPSREIRKVSVDAYASVGAVSNERWYLMNFGKAGRRRKMGRRPRVRGSAMNPVDHPHGGGEGRQPIGLKHPKTPWGKPARGVKTRKKKKQSDVFIVRRRQKRRR